MSLDDDIYNGLCVYREIGMKIGRLEKYEKSLQYFDKALERGLDLRALRGRAACRAQACKYNDALKDIATMLDVDPDNIYVSTSECLVKYLCCEFEKAMVDNLNKIPFRKKPDNFVMGAMHCEDAIQNNIGPRAGHPLRDHFKIIRRLAWIRVIESSKPYEPKTKYKRKKKEWADEKITKQLAAPEAKLPIPIDRKKTPRKSTTSVTTISSGIDTKEALMAESSSILETLHGTVDSGHKIPPLRSYPFRPIQRYTTNIHNLLGERYLDKMHEDKLFLQKLKTHQGIISPNKTGSKKIVGLAKKSSKYINYNQELLRARRPFYLLRLQDGKACGKFKERQLETERMMTKYCEGEVQNMIEKIRNAVVDSNLRQLVETAEKMYTFCESTPKRILPNCTNYLMELYSLIRDGFYTVKTLRRTMTKEQTYSRIAIILGMPKELQGSTDSLITQFKDFFVDKKKQCITFEARVRKSNCREAVVWFYHELSRLHFERKEFELSKAYGTKCLKESYVLKDNRWIINAMFLMIKVHVANRNKNGAKIELKNCRKIAKIIDDEDLDAFIEKCLEVLQDTPMDAIEPLKMLENRIRNIKKLMKSDLMKNKAELIFTRIALLPPKKRMSVLPGIMYPTSKPVPRIDAKPVTSKDIELTLKSNKKQKEMKDISGNRRGLNFLDLIQHHIDF